VKKLLLLFALSLSLGMSASASHLMGGQITAQHLGGLDYQVTLKIYRDTLGINVNSTENIYVSFNSTGSLFASVVALTLGPVSLGNGAEEYTYTGTVTLPIAGQYLLSWNSCCRNASIINVTDPGSAAMFLSSILDCSSTNSTPDFLNPPVTVAQQNQPFYYNPLPFDADGDSLHWSIDIPQDNGMTLQSSIPIAGYFHPLSDPSMPFSMDSLTGEISMLPNTIGNFVISIICEEYRQGVLLGEIRRDMQFIVSPAPNNPVPPAFVPNSTPSSYRTFTIPPGYAFQMSISAPDPDNQTVDIAANGEVFQLSQNPATFSVNGTTPVTADFQWTPAAMHSRSLPYLTVFRVSENFGPFTFSNDYSYRFFVDPTVTSVIDHQPAQVDVFPNPASEMLQVRYFNALDEKTTRLALFNAAGELVLERSFQIHSGEMLLQMSLQGLSDGLYLLTMNGNALKPVVVQH
jgi:hypothetical protein